MINFEVINWNVLHMMQIVVTAITLINVISIRKLSK